MKSLEKNSYNCRNLIVFLVLLTFTFMTVGAMLIYNSYTLTHSTQAELSKGNLVLNDVVAGKNDRQEPLNQTEIFEANKKISLSENQLLTDEAPSSNLDEKVILKIPLDLQDSPLSCEAAALKMALQYRGLKFSEDELMQKIGYAQPLKKIVKNGITIWGDPDIGYVGNEKGYLYTGKANFAGGNGWGVNNGPVAKAANSLRPNSYEKDNASLADLKQALRGDKPVILWHKRDDSLSGSWTYQSPTGKEVKLIQNHVSLLIGFETDNLGQTKYIFNDPIYKVIKYSEKDLIRIWGKYDNEIVVVN